MLKKNNVHLEGVLEAFQVVGETAGRSFALASVVTLHARPGSAATMRPSERFSKIHHELRVVAGKGKEQMLGMLSSAFEATRTEGSVFSCAVDGHLFSDGTESYIVCDMKNLKRVDRVKTSGNNRADILGEVVSTAHTGETATIKLRTDDGGIFSSLILRRQNQQCWDMVVDGKIVKGDKLSLSGPLLSNRETDGNNVIRSCQVSPHFIEKQRMEKSVTKKKGSVALA